MRKGTRSIELFTFTDGVRDTVELYPSKVVHAMCDGLERFGNMPDKFRIEMKSFGSTKFPADYEFQKEVCIGCAATCAIQELWHTEFDEANILVTQSRAAALKIETAELADLEAAIDQFRQGLLGWFGIYFGCELPIPQFGLMPLQNHTWKIHLPAYRAYAQQLDIWEQGY